MERLAGKTMHRLHVCDVEPHRSAFLGDEAVRPAIDQHAVAIQDQQP